MKQMIEFFSFGGICILLIMFFIHHGLNGQFLNTEKREVDLAASTAANYIDASAYASGRYVFHDKDINAYLQESLSKYDSYTLTLFDHAGATFNSETKEYTAGSKRVYRCIRGDTETDENLWNISKDQEAIAFGVSTPVNFVLENPYNSLRDKNYQIKKPTLILQVTKTYENTAADTELKRSDEKFYRAAIYEIEDYQNAG